MKYYITKQQHPRYQPSERVQNAKITALIGPKRHVLPLFLMLFPSLGAHTIDAEFWLENHIHAPYDTKRHL